MCRSPQIPGLKEDYKSLNLHINIAELIMERSGSADFRRRWQSERAMLEGDDCYEVSYFLSVVYDDGPWDPIRSLGVAEHRHMGVAHEERVGGL